MLLLSYQIPNSIPVNDPLWPVINKKNYCNQNVLQIALSVMGVVLSYVSLYPSATVVWRDDKPSASDVTSAIGVFLAFGTLNAWGYIKFFQDVFEYKSQKNYQQRRIFSSVALIAGSILLGLASRLPASGVALKMSTLPNDQKWFWAVLAVIGEAGPCIKSMYDSLEGFKNRCTCHNLEAIEIEEFREQIINNTDEQIRELFCPESKHKSDLLKGIKIIAQILLAAASTSLLHLQNASLTKDALDELGNPYSFLGWIAGAISALTFAKTAYQVSWNNVGRIIEKISAIKCAGYKKTLSEHYYPFASYLLEILALVISFLPSGELALIADKTTQSSDWYAQIFKYAGILSLALIIQNAFMEIIVEPCINTYASRENNPNEEIRFLANEYNKLLAKRKFTLNCSRSELYPSML